jgi:phytanoyl-CoA hydroxylase
MRRAVSFVTTACAGTRSFSSTFTDDHATTFFRDGIVAVEGMISHDTCDALRARVAHITAEEAAARAAAATPAAEAHVFSTTGRDHMRDDYFATSGNKVRFFLEEGCTELSLGSINKIGHALHTDGNVFQQFVQRQEFRGICRKLGRSQPSVIQSMYIMKPPKVGGAVVPHVDSTWLHSSPESSLGIWFALEDCTIENACLHAKLGSHHDIRRNGYARCTVDEGCTDGLSTTLHGDLPDIKLADMTPLEVKKGAMVCFNGEVIHASCDNTSDKSRHAFVFHVVDDACVWNERNWIAPTVSRLSL